MNTTSTSLQKQKLSINSIIRSTEDPKAAAAAMLARMVKEKKLAEDNFRVGLTKVTLFSVLLSYFHIKQ